LCILLLSFAQRIAVKAFIRTLHDSRTGNQDYCIVGSNL